MADPREQKLAELLVTYSVQLQRGESCLINAVDIPTTM
ncbi:MAG TPA: aminopeptidase, partial [Sphaerochaeta sp.]|nr:aminopeptidase [Sphaerochaeta sp.]